MQLKEILKNICPAQLPNAHQLLDIQSITCDSRKVTKDSLFVALKGISYDGTEFIDAAIRQGARVIVTNRLIDSNANQPDVCYLQTKDTSRFLRDVAQVFYGNPSDKVRTIGVTGTNGKTTTTYLIESILKAASEKVTVIGTINTRIDYEIFASLNTTPGFLDNQQILYDSYKRNVRHCVMEVSSHALDQGRVDLIDFKVGVFTNLASDHLDYHKTQHNYFLAKSRLFKQLSSNAYAVINNDNPYAGKLIRVTKAKVLTYGIQKASAFQAKNIAFTIGGSIFKIVTPDGEFQIEAKLIGMHNIYNILAAFAACYAENIDPQVIIQGIGRLEYVPGRLERVELGQSFSIFIDFAHTQDALENLLKTIKSTTQSRILLVFGCGGDRDKTKRPAMGRVASQLADVVFVTSDNPRTENPKTIIKEIIAGFKTGNDIVIENRHEAIYEALKTARAGDIVLIAGKGHETYQIFKDKTIPFNEREIIQEFFNANSR